MEMEKNGCEVLVSVIIPVYNVENYIERCVDSVRNQTWKNLEIVCVNDGTLDRSMEIVQQKADIDDRIKMVNIKNSGLSVARNVGMQSAAGNYICFLDSDDYLALDAIEKLVKCAEENGTDILFFGAESVFENEDIAKRQRGYATYYKRKAEYPGVYTGEELFVRMVNHYDFKPSACLVFINKVFIDQIQVSFYPGILHEDNLFTIQLMKSSGRAMVLDKPFYKRLIRGGSITSGEKSVSHAYGFYVCHREILKYISRCGYSIDFFEAVMGHFDNMKRNAVKCVANMDRNSILFQMSKLAPEETANFMEYIYEVRPTASFMQCKSPKDRLWEKCGRIGKRIARKLLGTIRWYRDTLQQFGPGYFLYRRSLKKNPDKICVSVVMPVYNVEKYLPAALDSLILQNLKNIEMICVDDGSTDSSWQILQEYSRKDARIKIYQQQKSGAGAARNYGMKMARGEYLLFLDSDDLFKENLCNEVYYQCIRKKADVCLFGAQRIDMQTLKKEPMGWVFRAADVPKSNLFSGADIPDKLFQLTSGCPWSKMFRREFIIEKGLEYQNLPNANDAFFVRMSLALAEKITSVNKVYVTYRYNEGNNIQSNKSKAPTAFYEAYKAIKNELKSRGVYEQYEKSFCNMALTESLANLRTAGTEQAQKIVYDLLRNEAIAFFEFLEHDATYYDKKQEYFEIKKIMENAY